MKKLSLSSLLLLFFTVSIADAVMVDPSRVVTWQGNVGSTATIPSAGTQVNCTQSPYNVPTNGTSDSAGAIRSCLNGISSGQVAYLPAGTYIIKSSIYVPSNKVLRGAGMGSTIIKGGTSWGGWGLAGFNPDGAQGLGTSVNISGSPAKGSVSITTSSAHGLSVGNYVIIDQLDNPSGDPPVSNQGAEGACTWCGRVSGRSLGQMSKVATVPSSTTFTVEIPLYWNYSSSLSPQVTKQNGMIVNAGVESLTLDNSVVQDAHVGLLWYAANCWFYQVDVNYTAREGISLVGYRNTIQSSKIHTTSLPLGSNSGYGLWGQGYASANLIEDNVIYDTSNPMIVNGQFSGNVIAYNFLHAHDGNTGRQNGAFSSHGAHPMMNLLEGNYMVGMVGLDFTWGSSSHWTLNRNRMQLQRPLNTYSQYRYLFYNCMKNQYGNLIGNILWTSGDSGIYEKSSGTLSESDILVYALGFKSDGSGGSGDSAVAFTEYRHGNYDYLNNAIQWDSGNSDHTLLNSLYLASSPSTWWCNESVWPPVNPTGPSVSDIPAKRRYDGASCQFGGLLPPANLQKVNP